MTDRDVKDRISAVRVAAIVMAVVVATACVFMFVTRSTHGAEGRVRSDLEMLQTTGSAGGHLTSMDEVLSKDAGKNMDRFLAKVRNFDYDVVGCERHDSEDPPYTTVTVRIRTYDFGSLYLAAWTDYLRSHSELKDDAAAESEFYDELFAKLADAGSKEYIRDVKITAMEPMDNGEWITDITGNEELQDALFGGMLGEMKKLAAG